MKEALKSGFKLYLHCDTCMSKPKPVSPKATETFSMDPKFPTKCSSCLMKQEVDEALENTASLHVQPISSAATSGSLWVVLVKKNRGPRNS